MNGQQAMGKYNKLRDLVPALERAVKDVTVRKDFTAKYVLSNALRLAVHERDTLHAKLSEVSI